MTPRRLPNYISTHRKRAGLPQAELAALLGYRKSQMSRLEQSKVLPSLFVAIACEVIFKAPIVELFPGLHAQVKEVTEARLRDLEGRLQGSSPKGRALKVIAHELEWLWRRKQSEKK